MNRSDLEALASLKEDPFREKIKEPDFQQIHEQELQIRFKEMASLLLYRYKKQSNEPLQCGFSPYLFQYKGVSIEHNGYAMEYKQFNLDPHLPNIVGKDDQQYYQKRFEDAFPGFKLRVEKMNKKYDYRVDFEALFPKNQKENK